MTDEDLTDIRIGERRPRSLGRTGERVDGARWSAHTDQVCYSFIDGLSDGDLNRVALGEFDDKATGWFSIGDQIRSSLLVDILVRGSVVP